MRKIRCVVHKFRVSHKTDTLPALPGGALAVTTVLAEAAPAWAVSGEGEPTGVDGLEGKLLLVWSGE